MQVDLEFGVRGCCRGLQWAHCTVLRRLYLQEGICPERWESLERRRGYSIYVFGLAAAGTKATEAIVHDPYLNTKRQLADEEAQGTPTRRRQKKHKICISLEVMTQSEQPKKEENDQENQKGQTKNKESSSPIDAMGQTKTRKTLHPSTRRGKQKTRKAPHT